MDTILAVRFEHNGKQEERVYDLRISEGRKAFINFSRWAVRQRFVFSCVSVLSPDYTPLT